MDGYSRFYVPYVAVISLFTISLPVLSAYDLDRAILLATMNQQTTWRTAKEQLKVGDDWMGDWMGALSKPY